LQLTRRPSRLRKLSRVPRGSRAAERGREKRSQLSPRRAVRPIYPFRRGRVVRRAHRAPAQAARRHTAGARRPDRHHSGAHLRLRARSISV